MPVRRLLPILALALALAAFPLGALASHDFADVPDANPFHADIGALADSGVTTGCGGGNYCPSAFVTREQMAAFMNRLGALAPGKTPVVNAAELQGLIPDQLIRSDVAYVGHYRCNVYDMLLSETSYGYGITAGFLYISTAVSGTAGCGILLPDGATISGVSWRVKDASPDFEVFGCALSVYDDNGAETVVASAGPTGDPAEPGFTTLSDASVLAGYEVVSNELYGYGLTCAFDGGTESVGVVYYQVTVDNEGLPLP